MGGWMSVSLFFARHAFLTCPVSLVPTFHGRGIMTAALRTLTDQWLIPYMNVHHMSGAYLDHNIGSKKVLEKNGWIFDKFEPDRIELPESMTGVKGKKFGMVLMKWGPSLRGLTEIFSLLAQKGRKGLNWKLRQSRSMKDKPSDRALNKVYGLNSCKF